jgi:hypothetical protein
MGLPQLGVDQPEKRVSGYHIGSTNNIGEPRNRPINCPSGDSRRLCSVLAEIRVRECGEGKVERDEGDVDFCALLGHELDSSVFI